MRPGTGLRFAAMTVAVLTAAAVGPIAAAVDDPPAPEQSVMPTEPASPTSPSAEPTATADAAADDTEADDAARDAAEKAAEEAAEAAEQAAEGVDDGDDGTGAPREGRQGHGHAYGTIDRIPGVGLARGHAKGPDHPSASAPGRSDRTPPGLDPEGPGHGKGHAYGHQEGKPGKPGKPEKDQHVAPDDAAVDGTA